MTPDRRRPEASAETRRRALEEMAREGVDVLVVGGGITGAGIARAAALHGWRVGLVEKDDFAHGTSSRSSKIVHGGVRYLEYGHVLLVRESARERFVLRRIAPHLVHRMEFLYPVWAPDSLLKIRAGLTLFDVLAGARGPDRHRNLPPAAVRERLPGLRDPLKGAVAYPEYITDDARLTLENILSAVQHGARVANYAPVVAFLRGADGSVRGVRVEDRLHGDAFEVQARCVVNAAGPWTETLLRDAHLPVRKPLRPSKGIHLLFSADRLPLRSATFLKASNGRRGLAMRRLDWVYVGTTDTEYRGPLDTPTATPDDVDDLLAMLQDCFPSAGLERTDILATWAGVRPLIAEPGKSTRDTSREDEVWRGPPGLVSIAGGKLTTYRRMAQRALRAVRRELGPPPRRRDRTAEVPLPGSPGAATPEFLAGVEDELARLDVAPDIRRRLCWLYGTQLTDLVAWGREDASWLAPLGPGVPAVRGEVRLAVEQEMAVTLVDFMDRRSALLLFSPRFGEAGAEEAASIMAGALGWDRQRRAQELAAYRAHMALHRVPGA